MSTLPSALIVSGQECGFINGMLAEVKDHGNTIEVLREGHSVQLTSIEPKAADTFEHNYMVNFCTLQAGVSSEASGEGPVEEQVDGVEPVDDTDLWMQAVGERKKVRVYGMGSEASVIHSHIGRAPPSPPSTSIPTPTPTPTPTSAAVDMTQIRHEIAKMFDSAMNNMVDQIVQRVLQRVSDIGSGSAAATSTHHDEQDPTAQD